MDIGIISSRYAKALLAYAFEEKTEDRVYQEMSILSRSFLEVHAFRAALDNPILSLEEKISLISSAAGGDVSETFIRFIKLIFHYRREKFLQFIALSYVNQYQRKKNITVGQLITAYPVDEVTEAKMKHMVQLATHGVVEFNSKIDPEIEGGFIFEVGTYRIDGSIADQFRRVKKQFIDKNRRIV